MTLPFAHLGHFLWILYLLPVVIVAAGIIYSSHAAKRDPGSSTSGPADTPSAEDDPLASKDLEPPGE